MAFYIWDKIEMLDALEEKRKDRRLDRLTFDCFNARVRGDRVYCAKGAPLGIAHDRCLALTSILRGWTANVCKTCKLFDG